MVAATINRSQLVAQNVDVLPHRSNGVRKPHFDAIWSVARDLPAKILEPQVKTRFPSFGGFGNQTGKALPREFRDIEATARRSQFSIQNFCQLSCDTSNMLVYFKLISTYFHLFSICFNCFEMFFMRIFKTIFVFSI